ncbi:unnamed protein product [Caenorhabditis auriculariae]|uniref:Uncharacterized protein n=1 Tax=Caenorhabditis auriculariae TaxID=2777116 RepID=A0A8S1GZQ0_9PELO|nr:unnamed protein product [Caenorhabditis auriculariae]
MCRLCASYAAQMIDLAIYQLCEAHCRMLNLTESDALVDVSIFAHKKLAREKKLTARRFWKVQRGSKLDPVDFDSASKIDIIKITLEDVHKICKPRPMSEDVQEALQKYEEIKTSMVKNGKFDPPKSLNPISDTRQRNHALMVAMKTSALKKVNPGDQFHKDAKMLLDRDHLSKDTRKGQLPKRSENQSKDKPKSPLPVSKDKGPASHTDRKPAGADAALSKTSPANDVSKVPVGKSTTQLTAHKAADQAPTQGATSAEIPLPPAKVRESEVDPKYSGKIPEEVGPPTLCKPMRIETSAFPEISKNFAGEPDDLRQSFTALTLICRKLEDVLKLHRDASHLILKTTQDAAMAKRGDCFEQTVLREREADPRIPLVRDCPCKDGGLKGLDSQDLLKELETLRTNGGGADEELYNLLENEERIRAQKLGISGKNYTYFWDKKTRTVEAILPGETFERAIKRKQEEMDNLERITELYKTRMCRLRATRKNTRGGKKEPRREKKVKKDDKKVAGNQEKRGKESEEKKNVKEKEESKKEEKIEEESKEKK